MGCMTIGSAGGFLKVTTWIANNTLPYLHGMTTTTAGLASYVLGALANFLLTPLAATTTMTSPVTELGIQMNMDPRILFYSFQYGLDNYLFPYEYAVILYFFSSGYMLFKDMLKVLAGPYGPHRHLPLLPRHPLLEDGSVRIPPRVSPGRPAVHPPPRGTAEGPARKCRARPKEKERLHVQAYLIGYGPAVPVHALSPGKRLRGHHRPRAAGL